MDDSKRLKIIFYILVAIIALVIILCVCNTFGIIVKCEMCGGKVFQSASKTVFGTTICNDCYEKSLGPLFDYLS